MTTEHDAKPEDGEYDPNDHLTWTPEEFAEHCEYLRRRGVEEAGRRAAAALRDLNIDPDDPVYDKVSALADRLEAEVEAVRIDDERYALYLKHYRAAVVGLSHEPRQAPEARTLEEQVAAALAVHDAKGDGDGPGLPMTRDETTAAINRFMYGDEV